MENFQDFNINDFSEDDYSDPILLLEAIKKRSNYYSDNMIINNSIEKSVGELLLITDVCSEFKITTDRIMSAIQSGVLLPKAIVPMFSREEISNYLSSSSSENSLMESFKMELNNMPMYYSYKPLLLLSLIENIENISTSVENIIDFYFNYYNNRKNQSLTIEKHDSTFVQFPNDRSRARRTILAYPVKVLSKKGFLFYDKETDSVNISNQIYSEIDNQMVEIIRQKCIKCLEKYYRTL